MKIINKSTRTYTFPTELFVPPNVVIEVPPHLEEAILTLKGVEVVVEEAPVVEKQFFTRKFKKDEPEIGDTEDTIEDGRSYFNS